MKFVSAVVKMNDDTFAPELEITVRLTFEEEFDGEPNAAYYEMIGRKLFSLLADNKNHIVKLNSMK